MRHSEKRRKESEGESASAAGPGKHREPASPHCRADRARRCSVLRGLTRAQWGSRNLAFAGFSL